MTHPIKPVFTMLFFCIAFVSCKKDLVNEYKQMPEPLVGKVVDTLSKAYSYYPFRDKSILSYVDTTIDGSTIISKSTLAILGDTTIDGKTYSKASTGGSETITYHNYQDGVTTLLSYNGDDKITTTVLKANEPVGTVWKDVFLNDGVPTTYAWKIVAKGINRTVLGVKYTDVMQVHLAGTADVPVQGKVVFANSEYFYAPNIGLIENISNNPATGITDLHRVLQKNIIP